MTIPIYCLGETMAVVASVDGSSLFVAETFILTAGGAESNVASHMAAQGHETYWLSRVGQDPLGDRIVRDLGARGVNTSLVARDPNHRTGVYFKDRVPGKSSRVFYYRSDSAASHMSVADLSRWRMPEGAHVHLSGITPALSESCSRLVDAILDGHYTVSFDVNYRAALWPTDRAAPRLRDLADRADTVLVGLDEAEMLWGTTSARDVLSLLPNPKRVVVKDGAHEAVEFTRGIKDGPEVVHEPAIPVEIVEPVGAGDAFAAGYLGALLNGSSSRERLRAGHQCAAWNLGSIHDVRPKYEGEYV